MKRAFLIILLAVGLAGCQSQTPTVDPFFGRTTVPPPPTGSIAGRPADPYYQSAPGMQPGALQANTLYNQGRATTTAPLYSGGPLTNSPAPVNSPAGSTWTNPFNTANSPPASTSTNQYNAPQYSSPATSALTGPPTTGAAGAAAPSPYSMQPAPQNNLNPGTPPAGYSPQATPAQPASMPSTIPGSNPPGGNRYTPPGNSSNYQGTSNLMPNSQPAPQSPNRVATPFFAGGVPNRKQSIPATDASSQPLDNAPTTAVVVNPPIYNPNIGPSQYVSSPPATYAGASLAGSANNPSGGQPPIAKTPQAQTGTQAYPQGNNYFLPASRQSASPAPSPPQNNSTQPVWRRSTSSDSRVVDGNIEVASDTEAKDSR